MKRVIRIFILSAGLNGYVQGQTTFEKVYLSSGTAKMNLIELTSLNLLVGLAWGPGISLLDPEGNVIQTNHYWNDAMLVQQSVKKYTENEYCFVTGYRQDSCTSNGNQTIPYTDPLIGRMDSLGNVLTMRSYRMNAGQCWNFPVDLEVNVDNSVITWGGGGQGVQRGFFALKADPVGNLVWAKHFDRFGSFQFMRELPGGDILAGMNMDTAGAVLARLDTDGNFLWCKSYIRPKGMVHDAVIESDDSFIIIGYTDSTAIANPFIPLPPAYDPKLFMMKVDGAGDVQWCRGYDSDINTWYVRRGLRIVKDQTGNHVVLANLGQLGLNLEFRPFLMKTDQNGDTLWTRSVGGDEYAYSTADLLACSDGGYLFSGIVYGDLPQGWSGAPYIFKTDSLGHFSCQERYHPVQVLDLFPTDSSFTLTSIDGATVHPAFVSDTTFAPIAVYDACLVTNVPPYHTSKQRSVRVYPNPTPGRFNLEFSDPLLRDSYYSVYDATGRLLLQRPLPTGATLEEVDLSRFGRGAYVLRLTDPEGVRHERVVVE